MDDFPSFLKDSQNTILIGKGGDVKLVTSQEDSISAHATRVGGTSGTKITLKRSRGKKQKPKQIAEPEYSSSEYLEEEEPKPVVAPIVKKETVFFSNDFGKIRLLVEAVMYNNEKAIGLIFTSVDDVMFEPKCGEYLELTTSRGSFNVMYPGTLFALPYDQKQLMVLYITNEPSATD